MWKRRLSRNFFLRILSSGNLFFLSPFVRLVPFLFLIKMGCFLAWYGRTVWARLIVSLIVNLPVTCGCFRRKMVWVRSTDGSGRTGAFDRTFGICFLFLHSQLKKGNTSVTAYTGARYRIHPPIPMVGTDGGCLVLTLSLFPFLLSLLFFFPKPFSVKIRVFL